MQTQDAHELWAAVNTRINIFNHLSGEQANDLYRVPPQPTVDAIKRLRQDLDALVEANSLDDDDSICTEYLTLRERLEALRDVVETDIDYTNRTQK